MRSSYKNSLILLCAALSACSESTPQQDPAQKGSGAHGPHAAPPKATLPLARPQSLTTKDDALEFSYRWPGEAAAIPELDRWLRANGEKLRRQSASEALSDQDEARKNGYPFNGHSYEEAFKTVADTRRMLVLLSDGYIYTGGAHGMPINTAIIWDKMAKKRLGTTALIDIPRLARIAHARFCDALDRQRANKRGEPVGYKDSALLADFSRCVALAKQLILPLSKNGQTLDTLRVVIAPYEAGPYAEGSYVIDLPMDRALLTTVKPAYRGAFGAS